MNRKSNELEHFHRKVTQQILEEKTKPNPNKRWIQTLQQYLDMDEVSVVDWKKDFIRMGDYIYFVGGVNVAAYVATELLSDYQMTQLFNQAMSEF